MKRYLSSDMTCVVVLVVEKASSGRMSPIRKRSVKDVEQVSVYSMDHKLCLYVCMLTNR